MTSRSNRWSFTVIVIVAGAIMSVVQVFQQSSNGRPDLGTLMYEDNKHRDHA